MKIWFVFKHWMVLNILGYIFWEKCRCILYSYDFPCYTNGFGTPENPILYWTQILIPVGFSIYILVSKSPIDKRIIFFIALLTIYFSIKFNNNFHLIINYLLSQFIYFITSITIMCYWFLALLFRRRDIIRNNPEYK